MFKQTQLILAVVLVSLTFQMNAQTTTFGVRGGSTFNTISQTEVLNAVTPDVDYLVGFSAAVFAEIPIVNGLAFQPELAFTQKGFSLAQGTDIDLFGAPLPVGVRANSKFNYLEAPLLMKAKFGSNQVQGFVMAGPALGYALNGRIKTETTGLLEFQLTDSEINLDAINYERFEFSGVVGAGVQFDAGFGNITLDGRFQQGFTELYDIPLVSERVKNRGFAVNAGLSIPLN
jgi:hypothetical protein